MHINHRKSHTVLIVDDEPDIALVLKLLIEDVGYKTHVITTADELYDLVPRKFFSLAIIDLNMPNVDGFALLEHVKRTSPEIPVIITTAHGSEDIAVKAMKSGAVDYLSKPFTTEIIKNMIDDVVTKALKERKNKNKKNKKQVVYTGSALEVQYLKQQIAKLQHVYDSSITNVGSYITKVIEFDEDSHQAGISILSYFSTIVKQKYPTTKVKVKIEQEGRIVRLIIVTPDGEKELIEKTLEEYGLVVVGQMQPEELLPNKVEEMQLRHKLDMAVMEISYTKELLAFTKESHKQEIAYLAKEVDHLKEQIREAFKREAHSREVLLKIIESHSVDGQAKEAILKLSDLIEHDVKEKDKEIIFELITVIKAQNQPAFETIKSYLIASFGGATGNLLSTWLPVFFTILAPK